MDEESIRQGKDLAGLHIERKYWTSGRQEMGSAEREITEIKLYSPLTGSFYDSEDHGKLLSSGALYGYKREIQKALEKDWIQQREKGLAEFIGNPELKGRIASMHPSVEAWWYSLWSVLEVKCQGALSPEELEALKDEWHGQMTDGWGEAFAQDAIDCDEGCRLYVDYRDTGRSGIKTEQELKGIMEEQEVHRDADVPQATGSTQTMGMG